MNLLRLLSYRYPTWAGAAGLEDESHAILRRYQRCSQAWQPHLNKCRNLIESILVEGETVVVLGSGWLLDIPLGAMLAHGSEIYLVDAVHPPPALRAAAWHSAIHLVHLDVTDSLQYLEKPALFSPNGVFSPPALDFLRCKSGLVISCCLLSQLALPLADAWTEQGEGREKIASLYQKMEKDHLQLLSHLGRRQCLIHDEETFQSEDRVHLLTALPLAKAEWEWELAPPGESDQPDLRRVRAWMFQGNQLASSRS